jgi:hypothetical protein
MEPDVSRPRKPDQNRERDHSFVASTVHTRYRNPPRVMEETREDVEELVNLVQRKPWLVQKWLQRRLNKHLDEELEVLASYVLSEMSLRHDYPEVLGPIYRGDYESGLSALVSRLRRQFAKLLRDHQRGEDDDFLDSCIVE